MMNLSQIKQQLIGASFEYHLDRDARLEGVQIGDLPFRLVRTLSEDDISMKNYVIKTKDNYHDFSYADIKEGRVRPITDFSLSSIKNSKSRTIFADMVGVLICSNTDDFGSSIEQFMTGGE
jgi:hypothetical protein